MLERGGGEGVGVGCRCVEVDVAKKVRDEERTDGVLQA